MKTTTCTTVASEMNKQSVIDDYHQQTKHTLKKYANGPDSLDWDTQPDPYRNFNGCPRFALTLAAKSLIVDFNDLFYPKQLKPAVLEQNTISALFELSLSLSAWKVYGPDRWALRINPSSGNLHPTEAYLLFNGTSMLPPGLYHYHSYDHCLEQRANLKANASKLAEYLPDNSLIIGLSSIHWREAWKYGERAYRYCQLDVGHAIASIRYAAALLGWQVEVLEHSSDAQIAALTGINRETDYEGAEPEVADVLLLIKTKEQTEHPQINPIIDLLKTADWKGQANCLSPENRINWPIINDVSDACIKPETEIIKKQADNYPDIVPCETRFDASSIIRYRRSAQSYDSKTELPLTQFYRIVDSLLPREKTLPFDSLPWQARIHPIFFIHRVEGIKPGLYALPRGEQAKEFLQKNLRKEFDWSRPPICPESLPLYHLISANSQNAAKTLSCHQAIASDSAFSVSMLAEFESSIDKKPWQYKQLFWEAGMLGQTLYLEAEAITNRGTGIGCYFDDAVHETLGISNNTLQAVYHFTVGTPVKDSRLITLPPYSHLNKA